MSAEAGAKKGLPHVSPVTASPSRRLDVVRVSVQDSEDEGKIDKKQVG
jgi:hypothetical protein